jgi:hypothetical protein
LLEIKIVFRIFRMSERWSTKGGVKTWRNQT